LPSTVNLEWQGNFDSGVVKYKVWLGKEKDKLVYVGDGKCIEETVYYFSPELNSESNNSRKNIGDGTSLIENSSSIKCEEKNGSDYWWRVESITETDTLWSGLWHFTIGENGQFNEGNGYIQVKCKPNVDVVLDNVFKGKATSSDGGIILKDVQPGKHVVKVFQPGFVPQIKDVKVRSGGMFVWEVEPLVPVIDISQENNYEDSEIKRELGSILVQSHPVECAIKIDKLGINSNKKMDRWKAEKIPTNTYNVEFHLKNRLLSEIVEIKPNVNTRVFVDFEKKTIEIIDDKLVNNQIIEDKQAFKQSENMVFVQGGAFQMGTSNRDRDERPFHTVIVSDFYIGKYEITQKEWIEVMGENPSNWKGDSLPVENVTWFDAVEFCNKKSSIEGFTPCYTGSGYMIECDFTADGYRLPTEAEWEYAARGGAKMHYRSSQKYSGSNKIDSVAWFNLNSDQKTHPVGGKKANELGIYDMSGNIGEWCNDLFENYSSVFQVNPRGKLYGRDRVVRGGDWACRAWDSRVKGRQNFLPDIAFDYIGVRLLRRSK